MPERVGTNLCEALHDLARETRHTVEREFARNAPPLLLPRALDLAFPEDVSLLGFDDSDWMTALRPYVSAIVQPIEEMAVEAWRLLIARLGGEGGAPARVQLPCTLQIRESTRPPAGIAIRRRTGLA